MSFNDKFIKFQLELTKPLVDRVQLDTARAMQNRIGRLMRYTRRRECVVHEEQFGEIRGAYVIPRDEIRSGLLVYIHGGGYTCGNLDYAVGISSVLCAKLGMRVATFEYRLAPEFPYPAALLDAVAVYRHILSEGYSPENIVLAGESAGGGLVLSLVRKLKEAGLKVPAGNILLSPWCDLTLSGDSYVENSTKDASLSIERLRFFANAYIGAIKDVKGKIRVKKSDADKEEHLKKDPFISPIFADLSDMPPTLIFAGEDELLLSDAENIYKKMSECGIPCKIISREGMWHAYNLYNLKSAEGDFDEMNLFLKGVLPKESERKLRWLGLDNSAKIYPAAANSRWTNIFRLSATLKESVDKATLQSSLDVTVRRFPSIAVRLRRGFFWYYLEEISHAPDIMDEKPYPLSRMPFDDIRNCAFRVLVYKNRIAVEFFHALTDGNGALIFLKTLLAEYLEEKHGIHIPYDDGVLDRLATPKIEELEDSFIRFSGKYAAARKEADSYRILGELEPDSFCHVTTFLLNSDELIEASHKYSVTLTAYLAAVFIKAGIALQNIDVDNEKKRRPVKVLIPCDLRRVFGSETLRNFALYSTPGVDPRLGEYSVGEIAGIVYRQMCLDITPKNMASRIRTNVKDEENFLLKITPLFIKNPVMKAVFLAVGEKKSMLSLSNLGRVKIPDAMEEYIDRFDFVLSVQSSAPYNAGVISFGNKLNINIIRNIKQPRLEMALYRILRDEGIAVKVESNGK